jgi:cytochrome c oxidase assembly protein subunit 15
VARRSIRLSPAAYQRITLFALVALGVIIVTGGAVRLTGSGLGCSDWPVCEQGQEIPPLEYHAWIEFGNRLFTGLVSVAVVLAVLGSLVRVPKRRDLTLWSWGLVAGVVAQILLGAIVVKTELVPSAVSAHFLVSMALVWNAVVLHVKAGEPDGPAVWVVAPVVRTLTRVLLGLLVLVLVLGTVVTGSGPHSGDPGEVDRLGFELTTVARVHSAAVWLLVATSVITVVTAVRTGAPASVRRWGTALLAVEVGQGAIGYLQYANGVPVELVAAHLVGAVAVWIVALRFALAQRVRHEREPAPVGTALDRVPEPARRVTAGAAVPSVAIPTGPAE